MRVAALGRNTVLISLGLYAACAWAGRPFATEDAGVIEKQRCELETYAAYTPGFAGGASPRGQWVQVGCGVGGRSQIALGMGRSQSADEALRGMAVVGKSQIHGAEDEPQWALAYTVSGSHSWRKIGKDGHAVVLVHTRPLDVGGLTMHANVGWTLDRPTRRNSMLWAAALERPELLPDVDVGVEAYGNDREAPMLGVGARWKVLDIMSFDASAAQRLSSTRETLYSLGLRVSW